MRKKVARKLAKIALRITSGKDPAEYRPLINNPNQNYSEGFRYVYRTLKKTYRRNPSI